MALLDILYRLQGDWKLKLYAVHLNHMLRGHQAEQDLQFCRDLACQLDIPFYGYRRDVAQYSRENGLNKQAAGRHLRYQIFSQVARQVRATKIAVAHHRNDVVETFFMRLLRGSGLKGLASIPPRRGQVIRPLYDVTRAEIEAYCRQRGLPYRTDPSNFSEYYWRNKVRLKLLPFLEEEFSPHLVEVVARIADIIQVENEFLNNLTDRSWRKITASDGREAQVKDHSPCISLCREALRSQHLALQRRLLQRAYQECAQSYYQLSFEHVHQLSELVEIGAGKMDLPGGVRVFASDCSLLFCKMDSDECSGTGDSKQQTGANPEQVELLSMGVNELRNWPLRVTLTEVSPAPRAVELAKSLKDPETRWKETGRWEVWMDYHKLKTPLVCRSRRQGDRFSPIGMLGTKKLKDYLIDKKVPACKRDQIALLCDRDGIVAVVGYQQADRTKLTETSQAALRVAVERRED